MNKEMLTPFQIKEALMKSRRLSDEVKEIVASEIDRIVGEYDPFNLLNYEFDGCLYEDVAEYPNCTVTVSRCIRCGKEDISWRKNDEQTEE